MESRANDGRRHCAGREHKAFTLRSGGSLARLLSASRIGPRWGAFANGLEPEEDRDLAWALASGRFPRGLASLLRGLRGQPAPRGVSPSEGQRTRRSHGRLEVELAVAAGPGPSPAVAASAGGAVTARSCLRRRRCATTWKPCGGRLTSGFASSQQVVVWGCTERSGPYIFTVEGSRSSSRHQNVTHVVRASSQRGADRLPRPTPPGSTNGAPSGTRFRRPPTKHRRWQRVLGGVALPTPGRRTRRTNGSRRLQDAWLEGAKSETRRFLGRRNRISRSLR